MSEQSSAVFLFDNSDPEMQRAYEQARATFKYFWRELAWERRRVVPALDLACGLASGALLTADLVPEPLRPVGGRLPVPRTPPAPDPALLDAYPADPDRTAWWRARLTRVAQYIR